MVSQNAPYTYIVSVEIRRMLTPVRLILYMLFCAYPFVYLAFAHSAYSLSDWIDVFTFMLDVIPMVGFAIAAVAVYDVAFSETLNHRFLIYERIRMPLGKLLRIKLTANVVLSFAALAFPVLLCFIAAYIVIPHYDWIKVSPNTFGLVDEAARNQEQAARHTMNQLLVYGEWMYGIACAVWVGLNAALYATFGFLLLLVIQRSFIALSIPFLLYMVGSFLMPDRRFYFFDSVFPFNAVQQPMWVMFVPFGFILLCCAALTLYIYLFKEKVNRLL